MTPAEIADRFKARLGDRVLEAKADGIHPFVRVAPAAWTEAARLAREELGCESLHDLTAVDGKATMTVVCHLWSFRNRHWVNLKAELPRDNPVVASLTPFWNGANWHERECWDMLGVRFEGHPNLRRILCPEDWEGHPLRKDYKMPESYHGIPGIPIVRGQEAEVGHSYPPPKKPAPPKAAVAPAPATPAPPPATAAAPAPKPPPPPAPGGGA